MGWMATGALAEWGCPTTNLLEKIMTPSTDRHLEPAAIRVDLGAIFISMELSRSSWVVTSLSPGGGEKMSRHTVPGGDVATLMARFLALQEKTRLRTGCDFPIIVIQEAGLDGFWIHRALASEGIESHVVDPASIATSWRRRRGAGRWCRWLRRSGWTTRRNSGTRWKRSRSRRRGSSSRGCRS